MSKEQKRPMAADPTQKPNQSKITQNKTNSNLQVTKFGQQNQQLVINKKQSTINMTADNTYSFPRVLRPKDSICVGIEIQANATEFSIDLLSTTQDTVYRLEATITDGSVTLLKVINGKRINESRHENIFNRYELNNDGNATTIRLFIGVKEFITYFGGSQLPHEIPLSHNHSMNNQDILSNIEGLRVLCDSGKVKELKFLYN